MNLRTAAYAHPYATMVTGVFLFSLLLTTLYYFGGIPGVRRSEPVLTRMTLITILLFITAIASWTAGVLTATPDE